MQHRLEDFAAHHPRIQIWYIRQGTLYLMMAQMPPISARLLRGSDRNLINSVKGIFVNSHRTPCDAGLANAHLAFRLQGWTQCIARSMADQSRCCDSVAGKLGSGKIIDPTGEIFQNLLDAVTRCTIAWKVRIAPINVAKRTGSGRACLANIPHSAERNEIVQDNWPDNIRPIIPRHDNEP